MAKKREPSMAQRIRDEMAENPDRSVADLAEYVGATRSQVYGIRSKMRKAAAGMPGPPRPSVEPKRRGRQSRPATKATEIHKTPVEMAGFKYPGTPDFEVSLNQLTDDLRTIRTMGRDRLNLVLSLLSLFEVTRPQKKEIKK